jgi:multimeric flavodoxin WrbA
MDVRKGQGPAKLPREEFSRRFRERFSDPAFDEHESAIDRLESVAWDAYSQGRKAPRTRRAGEGFADPSYELSLDWLNTRARLRAAQEEHDSSGTPSRVLVICGSSRNDATCPSEMSKSFRLSRLVRETLEPEHAVDLLDLSLLTSEYGKRINPCKGCVSTSMALCHWPCSCYPNHGLDQSADWMAEIYERWVRAHAIVIVSPVYWYGAPSGLKLMIDRLVCADGGNDDPSTTHGKHAEEAKALELAGWGYPKHLAGRVYGLVVHGDAAGTEALRRSLSDWLDAMGLVGAGTKALLDRYIGYYEPYATSHEALDGDLALQEEVRNVARAVASAVRALRRKELVVPDAGLRSPRPK